MGFLVEVAKSSRSTCKYRPCSEKINKGVPRIGIKEPPPPYFRGRGRGKGRFFSSEKWYHPKCAKLMLDRKKSGSGITHLDQLKVCRLFIRYYIVTIAHP
jgi:hypothetical protein